MKWKHALLPVAAVLFLVPEAESQSLVGTYLKCSTADEGEADFIMNQVFAPIYDRHVEEGAILGWGWVEHQVGGPWRRIVTLTADDTPAVMQAWGDITNAIREEHPNAWHRFNEICDSHDDYVWNLVAAAEGTEPGETPDQWVSTYWQCDEATESRADEIVQEMSAVFDSHVEAGHLGGWGWYAHDIGGWFRRLLTLTSAEGFNLVEARAMVVEELESEHAELLQEFSSICNGHVDYMWANGRAQSEG